MEISMENWGNTPNDEFPDELEESDEELDEELDEDSKEPEKPEEPEDSKVIKLRQKIKDLEETIENIRIVERKKTDQASTQDLQAIVSCLNEDNQRLDRESRKNQAELKKLQNSNRTLQDQIDDLETRNIKLRHKFAEFEDLKKQAESQLQSLIDKNKNRKEALLTRVCSLEQERDNHQIIQEDLKKLKNYPRNKKKYQSLVDSILAKIKTSSFVEVKTEISEEHPEPEIIQFPEWQWKDDDDTFKPYPKYTSITIEKSRLIRFDIILNSTDLQVRYTIDKLRNRQIRSGTGMERPIRRVIQDQEEKRYNMSLILGKLPMPDNWVPQTEFVKIIDVSFGVEYKQVTDWFTETNFKNNCTNYELVKIQRVQCPFRYKRFHEWKEMIESGTKWLYHGTSFTHPIAILSELDGLDPRLSGKDKFFGEGCYFTDNLHYVDEGNYRHQVQDNEYQVVVSNIALGKVFDAGTHRFGSKYKNLKKAPAGFHSVKGSSTVEMFVIYDFLQIYSNYILTYRKTT